METCLKDELDLLEFFGYFRQDVALLMLRSDGHVADLFDLEYFGKVQHEQLLGLDSHEENRVAFDVLDAKEAAE